MSRHKGRTLAFCIFKYFPHGGLQRDMLAIAGECHRRGHEVTVYTESWRGPAPSWLEIRLLAVGGLSNHARARHFAHQLEIALAADPVDVVIGFNKMPGLDMYYAADGCYKARAQQRHGWLYRLSPRYRRYQEFEEAVFGARSKTRILMLSKIQHALYVQCYGTPESRICRLPPNVARDRIAGADAPEIRRARRQALGLKDSDRLLLQLGSGFRTKGLDRSITALAHLPEALLARTRLHVAGSGSTRPYLRLASRLGVADQIVFLGPRDDVPAILLAADLLVHPAYNENTGTVLLEALASGLPVVASGVCGYASYIEQAQAGWVIPEPFDQDLFSHTVQQALERTDLADIGRRGAAFARSHDLYGMVERAVEIIERVAGNIGT